MFLILLATVTGRGKHPKIRPRNPRWIQTKLVGGFNPSEKYAPQIITPMRTTADDEKYESNWIISPGRGEHKKYF